jgi:hypothetical protein
LQRSRGAINRESAGFLRKSELDDGKMLRMKAIVRRLITPASSSRRILIHQGATSTLMGTDGRDAILRISAQSRKVRSKLSYLFARISQYVPPVDPNCSAFAST